MTSRAEQIVRELKQAETDRRTAARLQQENDQDGRRLVQRRAHTGCDQ